METLTRSIFLFCLGAYALAWWHRNDFVDQDLAAPEMLEEPAQQKARMREINVTVNGVDYRIDPQYRYEMHGLVVSYAHHSGDRMLHRRWNDHLNVADVCVVWGDNLAAEILNEFDIWNGEFTCNFSTRSDLAWQRFRPEQLSNNHLISADEGLREAVRALRVGDQIRVRGWLAAYSHEGGERGTSIVRTDTGNGACETIYLEEFEILQRMVTGWRQLATFSGIGALLSALLWVLGVGSGRFR